MGIAVEDPIASGPNGAGTPGNVGNRSSTHVHGDPGCSSWTEEEAGENGIQEEDSCACIP